MLTEQGDAPALLRLEGAAKTYRRAGREIVALRDFSLTLAPGDIVGLLGPNGSGKTTLIRALTGLSSADGGRLYWRGQAITVGRHGPHLREFGVLLEGRGACYERLSTLENAHYFCGLREAPFDREHFDALAALLEIPDVRAPLRQLSTGNKLRAALLGTLIHRPALALLDEPTLGLDLFGVEKLEALVRHLAGEGMTVLLGSHDLHFIERLCQRIVCIRQGSKVFDGSKSEFLRLEHEYLLQLQPGAGGLPALPPGRLWTACPRDPAGTWLLPLRDHEEACTLLELLRPALRGCRGMELRRVALRDKYLALVGEGESA
ncbi:ABC transporter ATP-binding protein [Roseateles sp. DAIF2]|uniref:ABC transporter ATP-binding protein n=1 Tax=Roseateles sp. DAIF2 TaxID=2714952 RepID=UPI0018A31D8E|nr:ABC transporter ATP-binding protein [Roseateles sp. DAIF2]QPF76322.1 ABC transporter ATP-binding protein [Roseateles sp. DAIF2]